MWNMVHELFLTQFEAGESISAIPRALRAILLTDLGALTHRGGLQPPRWVVSSSPGPDAGSGTANVSALAAGQLAP